MLVYFKEKRKSTIFKLNKDDNIHKSIPFNKRVPKL